METIRKYGPYVAVEVLLPGGTLIASHAVLSSLGDLFRLQDDITRRLVEALSLPLTILRPMAFMELMTEKKFFPAVGTWHVMPRLMGDSRRLPWICVDDLGAIAAQAFGAPQQFVGKDLTLATSAFMVTGRSAAEIAAAREQARAQIAFYASTRTYEPVLAVHGWQDLMPRLHRKSVEGDWAGMARLVSDEMMQEFAVEAPLGGLAEALTERYQHTYQELKPHWHWLKGIIAVAVANGKSHAVKPPARPPEVTPVRAREYLLCGAWQALFFLTYSFLGVIGAIGSRDTEMDDGEIERHELPAQRPFLQVFDDLGGLHSAIGLHLRFEGITSNAVL